MAIIYYYTKKDNLPIYLKYGIRLSKNFDKEINLNGYKKSFLTGLLNPKDDAFKYSSDDYTCIKLDVLSNHCKIVDLSSIHDSSEITKFIMLDDYNLGTFKNPVVLIDTSIISNKISLYNKIMDIPLLYNNSEELFYEVQINNLLNELPLKEAYELLSKK